VRPGRERIPHDRMTGVMIEAIQRKWEYPDE